MYVLDVDNVYYVSEGVIKINKKELLKALEKYKDDEVITILTKDTNGNPCLGSVEKISWVETPDGKIEVILVPCD